MFPKEWWVWWVEGVFVFFFLGACVKEFIKNASNPPQPTTSSSYIRCDGLGVFRRYTNFAVTEFSDDKGYLIHHTGVFGVNA